MPTFTETKTLKSVKLVPGDGNIIVEYAEVLFKDGVKVSETTTGRSYSNHQIADFEVEVAPTGASLADIVASFGAAAMEQRDDALAAKATAEAALTTAQAAHTAAIASAVAAAQAEHTTALASVQAELAAKDAEIARLTALIPAPVIVNGVPQTVTMRQARLALLASGLLDDVTAAVAGAGQAAQIEWEYASDVSRNAMLIQTLGGALGLTDEQLDGLFVLAATL